MWYDDEPTYDERYFRTLRRQMNDLLTEYKQTHSQAINSQDRTDKNKANEIRKLLEKKESELKLRKNGFTSDLLRGNIDKLTTKTSMSLSSSSISSPIGNHLWKGQWAEPQQIANATNSLRLLMIEPQQRAGVIDIQNTQSRPWHPPLILSQPSAQNRPTANSQQILSAQHSSVRANDHRSNIFYHPIATRTDKNRQSDTRVQERMPITHTNSLPYLHGTDHDGDKIDDASVTTFSSARSDQTMVPELVDIISINGENKHENLRKKYDKVNERKKKLNDHFNDKKKKYDDECRLLLGKMHSLSEVEGNEVNAQIGEEGQADM